MKLFVFALDNGDGSVSIKFTNEEHVKKAIEYAEDGRDGWWFADESMETIELPEGVTNETLGIRLWTPVEED